MPGQCVRRENKNEKPLASVFNNCQGVIHGQTTGLWKYDYDTLKLFLLLLIKEVLLWEGEWSSTNIPRKCCQESELCSGLLFKLVTRFWTSNLFHWLSVFPPVK